MNLTRTINADLLRTFMVVAETKHFTGAAQRLNASQSAVSMQIQRLEDGLGVRLLKRTKRDVRVTPEGEVLLRYAHRVARLTDEAFSEMGQRVTAGKVRVGATDMSLFYLPPVLRRFNSQHPMTDVVLRCDRSWEVLDALDAGDIDLAFVTQCCGRARGKLVTKSPLVWACAAHSDVADHDPIPLAIFGPGCIYRKSVIEALNARGKAFRFAYESASRDGLDCAVDAGLAVTTIPQDSVRDNLRIIEPSRGGYPKLPILKTYLFKEPSVQTVAVKAFSEVLVQTLAPKT